MRSGTASRNRPGRPAHDDVEAFGAVAQEVVFRELVAEAVGHGHPAGREQLEPLFESDLGFHACEVDTEAQVPAPAERQVLGLAGPIDVELLGVGVALIVPVGRANAHANAFAGMHWRPGELGVVQCRSE